MRIGPSFTAAASAVLAIMFAGHAVAQEWENLLQNPSFEDGVDERGIPLGWTLYGDLDENRRIRLVDEAHDGEWAVLIHDDDTAREIGLSQTVPAEAGRYYAAAAMVRGVEGETTEGSYLQLRFLPSHRLFQTALHAPDHETWNQVAVQGVAPEGTQRAVVYLYTHYEPVPKVVVDSVALHTYTPLEIERPRPLRHGLRLETGACAVVTCAEGAAQAEAIREALLAAGCDAPVVAHEAVDLAGETRDLIILGNLATSEAVEHLYRRMYTYENLYYPGGGGYVLRPLVDPLGTGGNILVVGASDEAGLEAGVEALLPLIAGADDVLEVPLTVETGEGYIGLTYLPWLNDGPRREMRPAAEYLKHGTPEAAQEYRRVMLDVADRTDREIADPDGDLHLYYITRTMSWDLMEACGVFSDEERLEIARALLRLLRSQEGYLYRGLDPGIRPRENHATRAGQALYYGWRHFHKYYADDLGPELTVWRHRLRDFWAACFASARTYEDSLSQHALGGSMVNLLDIALQEPEWSAEFFASGRARLMGERCIAIVNNMGRTVMLGDTGPGDYPAPVFSKLAYALDDGRYEFMLRKRAPLSTTSDEAMRGFNVGIEPVIPEDHLGLTVIPADEVYFNFLRNTEGVALEDAFDKLSFRSGFDPSDEYLMIDGTAGGSHSYDDANSIGEFSANERRWLVEIDVFNGPTMAFHNAVTVARDGLGQSLVPQSAELLHGTEGEDWAYAATRLPHYNGVHWTRHTLWMPGRQTVVVDEMTAYEPGDYSLVVGWRSLGEPRLDAGRFDTAQDDVQRAAVYAGGVDLYRAITDTSGKVARAMTEYNALLYRSEEEGDFVETTFEVPEAGQYEVVLQTLNYHGRGIAQMMVGGAPVGEPVDIFHGGAPLLKDNDLGTLRLEAGRHPVRFEIVGRNPASDNSFIAVCGLALYRPGEREAAAQVAANRLTLAFPADVAATLDRDTETLGKYLPPSPHHDPALNIVEQSMNRELTPGAAACFINAFSAWQEQDPGLEMRRLNEHCALVRRAGEIALVGAGLDGASADVGPLSASGLVFYLSPSVAVLYEARASLAGRDLATGEAPGEELAAALEAAWEAAGEAEIVAADPWADLPRLAALWSADLPDRPLSVGARHTGGEAHIAAGLDSGLVVQHEPAGGLPSGEFATGGPVHALEAADLDGEGAETLLVGSDDEHLYALDGDMGETWRKRVDFLAAEQVWMWWTLGSSKVRAIHAADIAGDGRPELLVGAGNMRLQCYDAGGELLWRFRTDHGICTTITTADVFGDGRTLVLAGNGLTSSIGACWVLDATGERVARYFNGGWCTSLPAIAVGDLNGDGVNTIITGSNRGDVRAFAPDTPWTQQVWLQNLPRPIRSLTVVPQEGGQAVVAAGSDTGYLCAFDAEGEKAWGLGLSSAIPFTALVRSGEQTLLAAGCRDGKVFLVTPAGRLVGLHDAGGRLEAMTVAQVGGADALVLATSGPDRLHLVGLQ